MLIPPSISKKKELSPTQIEQLKAPLPKEAIKPHPTKTFLSTIKAIYVVERLNKVFGIGGWYATNEVVKDDGKMIVVKSSFNAPEYGIIIPDIFGGNDNTDLGDAYKGACTDALTKIGSYLYIGMDVYKGLAEKGEVRTEVKKALITDGQFAKLLARIKDGDKSAGTKAQEIYSFSTEQFAQLKTAMK